MRERFDIRDEYKTASEIESKTHDKRNDITQ